MAAVRAGHGQRQAKAAAGAFDYRLPRLQFALFGGQRQHALGQRVLGRTCCAAEREIRVQRIRQIVFCTVPGKRHRRATVQRFVVAFADIHSSTAPRAGSARKIVSKSVYYIFLCLKMIFRENSAKSKGNLKQPERDLKKQPERDLKKQPEKDPRRNPKGSGKARKGSLEKKAHLWYNSLGPPRARCFSTRLFAVFCGMLSAGF